MAKRLAGVKGTEDDDKSKMMYTSSLTKLLKENCDFLSEQTDEILKLSQPHV